MNPGADTDRHSSIIAAILLSLFLVVAWLSLVLPPQTPPAVVPATSTPDTFSAERARLHLREVTRAPSPVGSEEHTRVREYLVDALEDLGLEPQVQEALSLARNGRTINAITVRNIVARIPGTNSSGAIVLAAHYDTVPHAPGATDAGNGVATILETVRALRSTEPLQNDVIVLITDAEEPGLHGARAYVDEHPWAEDTGIVLNAEGRGHRGPVIMFRTAGANGNMIRTLASTVPNAFADSMSNEIFRYMPNDTDLSIFQAAGYFGMDFANAHGFTHYHTPLDNFEAADPRSLQHHGDYMLALTRAFAAQDLTTLAAPDRTYFSLPLAGLVHYPSSWVLLLALLATLMVIVSMVRQARHGNIRVRNAGWGLLYFTAALIMVPLLAMGIWMVIRAWIPELAWFQHDSPYQSGKYLLAICLLMTAPCFYLVHLAGHRFRPAELLCAPLLFWSLLTLASAIWMPGASFLFMVPLLATGICLLLVRPDSAQQPLVTGLILFLLAIPVLIMMLPAIEGMGTMLTLEMLVIPVGFLVLTLGLLIYQVDFMARALSWKLPGLFAVAGVTILVTALLDNDFDENRRKPNSLNYIADANEETAYWYSLDPEPDEWTRRYLGNDPQQSTLPEWAPQNPFGFTNKPWIRPAPVLRDDAPDAEVLSDVLTENGRHVRLRITNPATAYVTILRFTNPQDIRLLRIGDRDIDGMTVNADGWVQMYLYGTFDQGIEMEFLAPPDASLELYLRSNVPGLPPSDFGEVGARPDYMMAAAGRWSDMTQLQRTVRLD